MNRIAELRKEKHLNQVGLAMKKECSECRNQRTRS